MQESEAVERNCQRLEKLLAAVSKPSKDAVGELERILPPDDARLLLTLLEYNGSKKPLVLQGHGRWIIWPWKVLWSNCKNVEITAE